MPNVPSKLSRTEEVAGRIREIRASLNKLMGSQDPDRVAEAKTIEASIDKLEADVAVRAVIIDEVERLLDKLTPESTLVQEQVRTLSKYTMLANAGGLTLALSQIGNLTDHGHSVGVLLIPLWAFGIGVLVSGLELMTSLVEPLTELRSGLEIAFEKMTSIGSRIATRQPQSISESDLRSLRYMGKVAPWLPAIAQLCFAGGWVVGLLAISFR